MSLTTNFVAASPVAWNVNPVTGWPKMARVRIAQSVADLWLRELMMPQEPLKVGSRNSIDW
jgi:hypothetical protein